MLRQPNFLEKTCTKSQLLDLCNAYEVKIAKNKKKADINQALVKAVLEADSMKNPDALKPRGSNNPDLTELVSLGSSETQAVEANVNQPGTTVTIQEPHGSHSKQDFPIECPGPSTSNSFPLEETEDPDVITKSSRVKGCSKRKPSKGKGKAKAKKKKVKFPCGGCSYECIENAIACDGCDDWYHFQCVDIDPENTTSEWYCQHCKM
ncbi:uncharacterized protein LOC134255346 [Saccostrea cucullata]|uniref:uncharacterized protein LOC134255346 n=1 Tax=Saccostrea cuccullata TaxID=36930 RepID=UPI002ED31506